MLHIGLTQRVDDLPERNERREGLDEAWNRWVLSAGHLPVPLPNQPEQAETLIDELKIGAIILTGGNDLADLPDAKNTAPQRDAFERKLLDLASQRGLPVLGVCRGMQMMVHHYGGKLIRIDGHVRVLHSVVAAKAELASLPRAEVNSFHSFGTRQELLPDELVATGLAADGTVEAIKHRNRPQWAIMWHPERTAVKETGSFEHNDFDLFQQLLESSKA